MSKPSEQIKREILEASARVTSELAMEAQAAGVLMPRETIGGRHPTPIQSLEHTSKTLRTFLDMLCAVNAEKSEIKGGQWEATIDISAGDCLRNFSITDFETVMREDNLEHLPPNQHLVIKYIKRMRGELKRILLA